MLLIVAGIAVWGLVQFRRIDRVNVTLSRAVTGQPQNYLIVGSDTRDLAHEDGADAGGIYGTDAPAGKRADTIVVARIDPTKATIELLSIPRDLWVSIPANGNRQQRINSAYNNGPQALIDTIHKNLGLDINHYVEVDFNGFKGLVEAIDGVPMYFDRPVYDRNTGLGIKKKGCITLNGVQALQFARSRHLVYSTGTKWETDPTGDLGRITRQQIFLRHAMAKTTTLGLTDVNTVRKLVGVAVDSVRIDSTLSSGDMMSLAKRFSNFDSKNLVTHRLPATADVTSNGADILRLDDAGARDVLDIFSGRKASAAVGSAAASSSTASTPTTVLSPAAVTVDVLNGSTTKGLALKIRDRVVAAGFTAGAVGNATGVTGTTVRYGAGARAGAEVLASKVSPAPTVVADPSVPAGGVQLIVLDDSPKLAKATSSTTTTPGASSTGHTAVAPDQATIGMVIGDPPPGVKCGG